MYIKYIMKSFLFQDSSDSLNKNNYVISFSSLQMQAGKVYILLTVFLRNTYAKLNNLGFELT